MPSRRQFLLALPGAFLAACAGVRRGKSATQRRSPTATPAPKQAGPTSSQPRAGAPSFVRNGRRDRPAVAVTFHGSGDVGLLDELLAIAARHRAPLTIFAVGKWLDDNPDLAGRLLAAGHELANHTYTHPPLAQVSATNVREEVVRCRDALVRHGGLPGRWFRPSGVETPDATILGAAAAAGYPVVVGYDTDPRDYQDPGSAAVRSRVAAGLRPGAIVSLHTGHRGTVDAMAGILDDLSARGLQPVTVATLLGA